MNPWVLIFRQVTIIGALFLFLFLFLFLISRKSLRSAPNKAAKIGVKADTRADILMRARQFPAVRQAARHWADDFAQRLKNHPAGWVGLQVGRTNPDGSPLSKHVLVEQYEAALG